MRPDLERAAHDAGDAAAAGADGMHRDLGNLDRQAGDAPLGGELDLAVTHDADVEAGAAHVDGNDVAVTRGGRRRDGADDTAGRA